MNKCGLYLRKQNQMFTNNEYEIFEKFKYYNYDEIALLSIGIWSAHSCYSATERIHELAEKANIFIKKMRSNGSHIIHCGSYSNYHCKTGNWNDTMLRKNIKGHPMASLQDKGMSIPPLPLDDSDGGYEKSDKNMEYDKSKISIHPKIEIDYEKDCISDYSKEILNYLHAKKIKVILCFGTHTNMCILDKPYGIKGYIRYGFPVILVRDLCDCMYNSNKKPSISHDEANNINISWFEKYICPTIDSNEVLNLNNKTIFIDIDNTITTGKGYENECFPKKDVIEDLNNLYQKNYNIVYWTSRGVISDNNWYKHTFNQLKNWGVKFTLLITKKPYFDFFLEDKSLNLDECSLEYCINKILL
jgi:hypothetical protein